MGNNVHVIAIPPAETALAKCLGRIHVDYARWLNVRGGQTGHVWQNRFFSCPRDEAHQWEALRYVECNPVRARLVNEAPDWPWSSAAAHTGGTDRWGALDVAEWERRWTSETWREALGSGTDAALWERIREATQTGRPAAGEEFVKRLEAERKRRLLPQKRGPKAKKAPDERQMSLLAGSFRSFVASVENPSSTPP